MPDLQEITQIAKRLGIKPTNAEEGSELFDCWADRVVLAQSYLDGISEAEGQERYQRRDWCEIHFAHAVRAANSYAI